MLTRMPMISTTTISSMRVKPSSSKIAACRFLEILTVFPRSSGSWLPARARRVGQRVRARAVGRRRRGAVLGACRVGPADVGHVAQEVAGARVRHGRQADLLLRGGPVRPRQEAD